MASSSTCFYLEKYPCPSESKVEEYVTEKLSDSNYEKWRELMFKFIKSQRLDSFIYGTDEPPLEMVSVPVPVPNAGGGGGDSTSGSQKYIKNEEYKYWKKSNDLVRGWILTMLTKDTAKRVLRFKNAKAVWTALEYFKGRYVALHRAAIEGDWEMASKFIKNEPDNTAVRAAITADLETALIVAVKSNQRNNFVKKLVEEHMSQEDLALGDSRKRTALHRAAGAGNMEAAKLLVKNNQNLPNVETYDKRIPLFFAAARGHRQMVLYLFSVTTIDGNTHYLSQLLSKNGLLPLSQNKPKSFKPFEGEPGFRILHQLTINGLYDIALALLQDKPELACFIPEKEKDLQFHSLMAIAQKPSSFQSGTSFHVWQKLIYSCVPLKLAKNADHHSRGDIENPVNCITSGVVEAKKRVHSMFWEIVQNFVPCIKHVREKKMIHNQAQELVQFLCNEIVKSNYSNAGKIFSLPLVQATSVGIHEIVEAILRSYPDAISLQNQKKQSIFHQAIVYRREKVFNLIRQVESRTIFLSQLDESNNNALHLAGYMAPQQQLYLRAGAALQMQRELHWFKEVEKLVVPRSKEERNDKKMTPAEVFTDTHKDLVKEGERWMKDTANACTILAALIATVVFAAAITVPGGNNGDGNPIFCKRACFIIFGISDAFALFSSVTSVLLFMSILTSRYAEHDFLVLLPNRLMFGLVTLFLCILSTMIAFGATLYLVFGESYKAWITMPILALPCIPVALFVCLKFPLLAHMFKSTNWSIFVKQSHVMLY
ncbi:hypothetical protein CsSME_00000399 [Camellia sinensis var. sinensis]